MIGGGLMEHIVNKKSGYTFNDLFEVVEILRGENGCPWDREQTHESIKMNTIEEAYEVVEAINNNDKANLREELGDMLLHVVFHAKIAESEGDFNIDDVANEIVTKLIRRHPHVFKNDLVDSSEAVIQKWEEIKKEEKNHKNMSESMLDVPKVLPSLMRAAKVQKKAANVGFDFPNYTEAMGKFHEEVLELEDAISKDDKGNIEEEFGDVLFSLVNISRFFGLNLENCLTNSTEKFINRFIGIEQLASSEGQDLVDLDLSEMDILWEKVKKARDNQ